ncbi:methyltransferase-domain-containing protein [Corynascus similis CBS 632.67]
MFPVKGLSISAEKLKVETGGPTTAAASSAPKTATKRKRPSHSGNVTADNFADLWEKVIEPKESSGSGDKAQSKQDNKRQKTEHGSPAIVPSGTKERQRSSDKLERKQKKKDKKEKRESLVGKPEPIESTKEADEWNGIDDEEIHETTLTSRENTDEKRERKKKKKQKGDAGNKSDPKDVDSKPRSEPAVPPPAPPASTPKLTPLQASMREKLISARFRHLNETLYTRPSAEAFQLFEESPEMFTEYHEGFRRQVEVWPENPVDGYIADIKARAKVRFPPRNRNTAVAASQLPLPKASNSRTCTIADLGCGDAKLATALQPLAKKLHLDIRSFDLQTGGSPLVTRADISNLPLPDGSVDVAIFCLALMGTNWLAFIEEAYRVLRWRGELWVAEIKSRFTNPSNNSKAARTVVAHSVGNRKKGPAAARPPQSKQARAAAAEEEEAADLADLAVHVDGDESGKPQQNETDIGAFVEALRKRGFLLNRDLGGEGGSGAVDMSNRMFVRMHFVKAAPALRGKCATPGAGEGSQASARKWTDGKGRVVQKKKFIENDDTGGGDQEENEATVLKPCVYKIR